jgi:hypothetical protein
LVAEAGAEVLSIVAPDLAEARAAAARFPGLSRLELELDDYAGLEGDDLDGRQVVRAVASTSTAARALLALPATFEVVVLLDRETAPWLLSLAEPPPRLAIRQPTYERLTESAERDVDLADFFAAFRHPVPVEAVPACLTGRPPRARPEPLDTAMMTVDGRLDVFRYAKRFVLAHYLTKSLRCRGCVHDRDCAGVHVNYVRAHGYAVLRPVSPA